MEVRKSCLSRWPPFSYRMSCCKFDEPLAYVWKVDQDL
jgi:hypothetical protein